MFFKPKQKPCCWCPNQTKSMLLMPEQNKIYVVDAGTKQKPYWWCRNKKKPCHNAGTKQNPFAMVSKKWCDQFFHVISDFYKKIFDQCLALSIIHASFWDWGVWRCWVHANVELNCWIWKKVHQRVVNKISYEDWRLNNALGPMCLCHLLKNLSDIKSFVVAGYCSASGSQCPCTGRYIVAA